MLERKRTSETFEREKKVTYFGLEKQLKIMSVFNILLSMCFLALHEYI